MLHAHSNAFDGTHQPVLALMTLDDVLSNLETYRTDLLKGFDVLRQNTDFCADPRVASVFIECALAANRVDLADMVLPMADDASGIFAAMILMAKDEPKLALAAMTAMPSDPRHQAYAFGLRIQAYVRTRHYDLASKTVYEWAQLNTASPEPYRVMGNALAAKGDSRAERWFERAMNVSSSDDGTLALDMAAFLIKKDRTDEAGAYLNATEPSQGRLKRRKQRLLRAL